MKMVAQTLVTEYVRLWPREIFDCADESAGKGIIAKNLKVLSQPGVYVLYRDGQPCYVGKADRLRRRLYQHANSPGNRLYSVWNQFSAFVVLDSKLRTHLEGVLIASMPTANGAKPKLPKQLVPKAVRALIKRIRLARSGAMSYAARA